MFSEGAVVGEYTLQRKVGQGPLAEVWRASRADRGEPLSLKILKPGALAPSDMRRAFDRLGIALSKTGRLEHPHLPAAVGTVRRPSDGLFGIASLYFEGGPLIDAGDLTDPPALHDALELVIQLGQTIMWLHDQGHVHGSIKPTNVLASPSPDGPTIRLLDLCWSQAGLCRLEGTRFEPPELKHGPPTPATDQWAVARLIRGLVARRAPEPIGAWARVPPDLRTAVDKSLSEDPSQRFERIAHLVDALVEAQIGLSSTAPTRPAPDQLPAPTVPLLKKRPQVSESHDESSADKALPEVVDVPTQPTISDAQEIRNLAGAARTMGVLAVEKGEPTTPGSLQTIDPSADSQVLSDQFEPLSTGAEARAPTETPSDEWSEEVSDFSDHGEASSTDSDPFSTTEESRGWSLPAIVAIAAALAIAAYAWTIVPADDDAPARVERPSSTAVKTTNMPDPTNPTRGPSAPPSAAGSNSPGSARPPSATGGARGTLATARPPAANPAPSKPTTATRPTTPRPSAAPTTAPADRKPTPAAPVPPADALEANVQAKDAAWGDCQGGLLRACLELAKQHERGNHWRSAARARDQACRIGHKESCFVAARHFERTGAGRTARRKFERLCDNGDGKACAELSRLFQQGIGGSKSARYAQVFKTRACKLGHRPSCR